MNQSEWMSRMDRMMGLLDMSLQRAAAPQPAPVIHVHIGDPTKKKPTDGTVDADVPEPGGAPRPYPS